MLRDPVLEERVRHAHRYRPPIIGNERCRLEPRIEAVTIHFRLNARQDFFPNIAGNHGDSCAFAFTARRRIAFGFLAERQEWLQIVLGGLSPSKTVQKQGYFSNSYAKEHEFPQVFAQVWKTLGGDQIPYASLKSVSRWAQKRECSIRARFVDRLVRPPLGL